jgi:glycosyltransferase involved in cell wall biosynthesis
MVLAPRESKVDGTFVPLDSPRTPIDAGVRERIYERMRTRIASLVEDGSIDVVHYHGYDFCQYLPPDGVTVLATLHLPISLYHPVIFRLGRPRTYLHCVSRSQRADCPDCDDLLPEIQNGVPVEELGPPTRKRSFAVSLGRICPEKNVHAALEAGRLAGVPVLLAGKVFPYVEHQRYFERKVRPRLDRLRRFLGPLGFRAKRRLLAAARCLLVTSVARETSSLAAMEALASGTPVVAFRTGALPDMIEPGVTGFLVRDRGEMAEAIHEAGRLDPEVCRRAARERFSLDRMLSGYMRTYLGVVAAARSA